MFDPDPELDALLQKLLHPDLKKIDPTLVRIEKLLAALDNPQTQLPPVVHVAGTNGKGSVIAYLRAILKAAGYRVHSYTSPHLVRFSERIRLHDREITKDRLMPLAQRVLAMQQDYPATFFEATTAVAFLAFAEEPADVVLLETGMGGRLDATNVIARPAATVITPVGMDHAEYLGDSIAAIAGEKAAILKPGVCGIIGSQVAEAQAVIERMAQQRGATLSRMGQEWHWERRGKNWDYRGQTEYSRLPVPGLAGEHQYANAATALAALERLRGFPLTPLAIQEGLQSVDWPARLQPLKKGYWRERLPQHFSLFLDGGHNPMAGQRLSLWLKGQKPPHYLITGMLKDKDAAGFLLCFKPLGVKAFTVSIRDENCHSAKELSAIAQERGLQASSCETVEQALAAVAEQEPGTVLICGSLYLCGQVLAKN